MMGVVPIEHRFAATAGELCWFEWGTPVDDKPTLLLIHATGFHARLWDPVVAALGEGWHIVAPDLRGHGLSYRPETLTDWLETAEDVIQLSDACLKGPVIAVGHSMGAFVAARLSAMRPDLVERMILVDPVMMAPELYGQDGGWTFSDPGEHPVARRRNSWESAEEMVAHFSGRLPYSNWERAALEAYCQHGLVLAANGEGLELACQPFLEASCYIGSLARSPYQWVDAIKAPTTVIRARLAERSSSMDFSISPTWPRLSMMFPGGQDLHWSDLSHFIPMEAPARLAKLIGEQG
jgi:lipase